MDPEELITTKQAGEIKGWTPQYIVDLINQGRLKATKISHIWLIRRGDLEHIKPASRPVGRPRKKTE